MAHEETVVLVLPKCDFGCGNDAEYDGKTREGPWANMCPAHFMRYGLGTGLGRGQRLVPKETSNG